MNPIVVVRQAEPKVSTLVERWLSSVAAKTRKAYQADIIDFSKYAAEALSIEPTSAIESFLRLSSPAAHDLTLGYVATLAGRELSSSTIARRLAAIKSVVKLGRVLGLVTWSIEIKAPKAEAYRNAIGPNDDEWARVISIAKLDRTEIGIRNLAMILVTHDLALRAGELLGLDLAHVELDQAGKPSRIHILGKRRRDREPISIAESPRAVAALADWIAIRGSEPGPLFIPLDRSSKYCGLRRLTITGWEKTLDRIGGESGLGRRLHPHAIRHRAAAKVHSATGGNILAVSAKLRHSSVAVTEGYLRAIDRRNLVDNATRILADS